MWCEDGQRRISGDNHMILYPDCDYYNEYRDDEFSPYPDECEACYRYEICLNFKLNGESYASN